MIKKIRRKNEHINVEFNCFSIFFIKKYYFTVVSNFGAEKYRNQTIKYRKIKILVPDF